MAELTERERSCCFSALSLGPNPGEGGACDVYVEDSDVAGLEPAIGDRVDARGHFLRGGQEPNAFCRMNSAVIDGGGGPQDQAGRFLERRGALERLGALGEAWRARFGKHYPAMALVEVKGLVDRGAMVEIEATAVIGNGRP